jgi:hypothetical protein
MRRLALAALLAGLSAPVAAPAQAFQQITEAGEFNQTVVGRELSRFGIRLQVTPEGGIQGRGFGYPVTGSWRWESGFSAGSWTGAGPRSRTTARRCCATATGCGSSRTRGAATTPISRLR